ncbi:MAG TPA: tetratricopeptide repeat protein, partial [Candidatus Ozemobacteraceae bacterium]|nr:tetratricopeptide repeat protein [Candidatus Ozemobacteraceae bacterium]
ATAAPAPAVPARRGHVLYEAPPGAPENPASVPAAPAASKQRVDLPAGKVAPSASETISLASEKPGDVATPSTEPKLSELVKPEDADLPPEALAMLTPPPADGRHLVRNATPGNEALALATGSALLFDAERMPERKSAIKVESRVASAAKSDDDALAHATAVEETPEPSTGAIPEASGAKDLPRILEQGRSKYYQGAWEEALPLFLEYLKHHPSGEVYDLVGNVFVKLKMNDDAYAASEHAYQLGYKQPATLIRLGSLAQGLKRYDAGATYLKEALDKVPHRMDVKLTYAACLRGLGEYTKAETIYRQLLSGSPLSPALKSRVEKELQTLQQMNPGKR